MFTLGLLFILIASMFAAFLPTSPFQSPLSEFIRFVFKIFPDYPLPALHKCPNILRISSMILASVAMAVMAAVWTLKWYSIAYLSMLCFPVACVSALAAPHPEKKEEMKPRIYGLPAWALFSSFTTITVFAISAWIFVKDGRPAPFIILFSFGCALIPVQGYHLIQISKSAPDTTTAEAVTWMLMNSSSKNTTWFQKAAKIASSDVKQAVLLENLLPLLSPLITSIPHPHPPIPRPRSPIPRPQSPISRLQSPIPHPQSPILHLQSPVPHPHPPTALHPDQVVYVACLARLCKFTPSAGSFWNNLWLNQVAFPRPRFSQDLEEKLQQLSDCPYCPEEVRADATLALRFSAQSGKERLSENSIV